MKEDTLLLSFDPGTHNMGTCALRPDGTIVDWARWSFDGTISDLVLSLDAWVFFVTSPRTTLIVILERQPPRNHKTCRVQIVLETYFAVQWADRAIVKLVHPNTKWRCLGRLVPSTYAERKRASVNLCRESVSGGDWEEFFETTRKQDDLADAYLQCMCALSTC